jgi:uncharacterized protein (DUF488 family)
MHTIYTIGYSGWTPAALKAAVDARGVLLVDIRYSPRSRRPEWRTDALARLWGENVAQHYVWWRELGNVNYKGEGPIVLADPELALVPAATLLIWRPIALLCACRRHEGCHRLTAADYLSQALGAPVEHLYPA